MSRTSVRFRITGKNFEHATAKTATPNGLDRSRRQTDSTTGRIRYDRGPETVALVVIVLNAG
jgi:hypothetical protein